MAMNVGAAGGDEDEVVSSITSISGVVFISTITSGSPPLLEPAFIPMCGSWFSRAAAVR